MFLQERGVAMYLQDRDMSAAWSKMEPIMGVGVSVHVFFYALICYMSCMN